MILYLKVRNILLGLIFLITVITVNGCQETGYVTPPTQTLSASLNTRATEGNPSFSYDGRYLIVTSDRPRGGGLTPNLGSKVSIFLYDLQSRRLINLPGLNKPGSMQSQADISADGRYIVYVSEELGKTDIFVYDRLALKSENITKNFIGEVRHPTISGNGRFIAFEGNRSGQWDIEIYDRGLGTDLSLPSNLSDNSQESP